MEVFVERGKEEKQLEFNGTAEELLKELAINSEEVIVSRNNELITLDEKLKNSDKIKILSVISGG